MAWKAEIKSRRGHRSGWISDKLSPDVRGAGWQMN